MNKQKLWFITWKLDKNNIARFFLRNIYFYSAAKRRAIEPTPPARLCHHHVSITASRPISAPLLNPCIYTWAIFHNFQIIMLATWNWKIITLLSSPDHINKNCRHKVLKGNSPRIIAMHGVYIYTHVRTLGTVRAVSCRLCVQCTQCMCTWPVHGYSGPIITWHFRASWLDKFA